MPLEACLLVIDNSEFMRNGDYQPTRFQAQKDAVSVIFNAKTLSNPENTVGLMSMAGHSPQVLATLTPNFGKILSAFSTSTIGGSSDLITSLNVAQLALKHRENKNQRQRIIVFVGSPVTSPTAAAGSSSSKSAATGVTEEGLVKLGKKLKKNNVAVDIICFGDEGIEAEPLLSKFVEAVNSSDNSHIITIPPGTHLLSDQITNSPILASEAGQVAASGVDADGFPTGNFGEDVGGDGFGGGGGGDGGEFGGIDPNMDPEMAMAIRMSLQEAEERERREQEQAAGASSSSATATATAPAAPTTSESAPLLAPSSDDVDMDSSSSAAAQPHVPAPATSLAPAAALPSGTSAAAASASASTPAAPTANADTEMAGTGAGAGAADEEEDEDDDDEAAMLKAIAMSMEGQGQGQGDEKK